MKNRKRLFGWLAAVVVSLLLYGNVNQTEDIRQVLDSWTQTLSSASGEEGEQDFGTQGPTPVLTWTAIEDIPRIDLTQIPAYQEEPYYVMNNNIPYFSTSSGSTDSFEYYGDLDSLNRCTIAYANVGQDLMPTEERGSISSVKPTGWQSVQYDCVDGKNLYNRCHLIGWQLTAENANKKNLITGTRYLNVEGMLPFENLIADYVKETGNHVMYRVTPIFEEDNLVASGVLMEAWSVEDEGDGVCFNVYAYNNQPQIVIDYATGDNWEQ